MQYAIAIHGGAGTILRSGMTPEYETAYTSALSEAIFAGENILKNGGASLDAVEQAVRILEDNPLFNAGRGSVFSAAGKNEMDACIMNGLTLDAGAVAGITNIRNPVSLARAVMERSGHVLLCGTGAMEFAGSINTKFEDDEYFWVQFRREQFDSVKNSSATLLDHTPDEHTPDKHTPDDHKKFGTVGAVALDIHGNLAAATSTGGMTNKKFGRIGDSPIVGAGTYANNNTCAISCTGHGEFFIRSVVAYDISCLMEYKGMTLKQACEFVVMDKLQKSGGEGGLIAVDRNGNIEMPFNTLGMYRGSKSSSTELFTGIYR
jgi:L-asparaginase / beta-aspartyl-peptidase